MPAGRAVTVVKWDRFDITTSDSSCTEKHSGKELKRLKRKEPRREEKLIGFVLYSIERRRGELCLGGKESQLA